MSGELTVPVDIRPYGLDARYGLIKLGNLELRAHKINVYFDDYVTMTVEYRAANGDTRANFLITTGGVDQEHTVQEMKNQLDAMMKGQE